MCVVFCYVCIGACAVDLECNYYVHVTVCVLYRMRSICKWLTTSWSVKASVLIRCYSRLNITIHGGSRRDRNPEPTGTLGAEKTD